VNLVHNLISAYGLLSELDILPSEPASHKRLCKIHSKDYVDILRQANKSGFELSDELADNYNLGLLFFFVLLKLLTLSFIIGYDCPLLPRMYNFVRIVAGASLQAAKVLNSGKTTRAINWQGGWHHAQRYYFLITQFS
jgi:acetoin utilization deacetylase AcuC-like enzyme